MYNNITLLVEKSEIILYGKCAVDKFKICRKTVFTFYWSTLLTKRKNSSGRKLIAAMLTNRNSLECYPYFS